MFAIFVLSHIKPCEEFSFSAFALSAGFLQELSCKFRSFRESVVVSGLPKGHALKPYSPRDARSHSRKHLWMNFFFLAKGKKSSLPLYGADVSFINLSLGVCERFAWGWRKHHQKSLWRKFQSPLSNFATLPFIASTDLSRKLTTDLLSKNEKFSQSLNLFSEGCIRNFSQMSNLLSISYIWNYVLEMPKVASDERS